MRNWAIFIAAILLSVFAFIHLVRLFFPFPVMIGSYSMPECASLVGFLGAGIVAAFLLKEALER